MDDSTCRHCDSTATHDYSGQHVCAEHYKMLAADDDSPNHIPADYDWSEEMDARRLDQS